nr:RNA-directed DNA polymerase, eukaryota, reverse transcriptase zinc-binding domain protein [Tanacetum cinerariifolium]
MVDHKGRWVNKEWKWCWEWSKVARGVEVGCKGYFSVKALSRWIDQMMGVEDVNKTLWNNLVPRKVSVFVWLALYGRLHVRTELYKKGIDLDTLLFPGYDNVVESLDHCLVLCENLLCHKGKSSMGKERRLLWQMTIWMATILFGRIVILGYLRGSLRIVQDSSIIQLITFEWIYMRARKWEIQWEKWLTSPTECGV